MPYIMDSTKVNYDVALRNLQKKVDELVLEVSQIDISEINQEISQLQRSVTTLQNQVITLVNDYDSQYHLIETIDLVITPNDFTNNQYIYENEILKLNDSIISWSPVGTIYNVGVISNAMIVLLPQVQEGKIVFACNTLPSDNVELTLTVNVKGTATN